MADAVTNHTNRNQLRSFYFFPPMLGFEISRELICVFSVLCVLMSRSVAADEADFMMEEFQKKEFSLAKPYRGLGFSSSSQWDLMGTAMVTPDYVRLTPDLQSRQGAVWSRIPLFLRDWELKVHFKIHGVGKKNFNGDGLAIWLTRDRMQNGPVFGNMNQFTGLGVFIDTYPNADRLHDTGYDTFLPLDFWNIRGHNLALRQNQCRSYPYISVMLGNGTLTYDHDRDGRATELGGCTALVRNSIYDTFLLIRYSRNRLKLMVNVDGTQEWKECADISGLHLPTGYFLGASSATGDLSDNHDIISLKLYQLTVQRGAEEEEEEVTIPRVDNINLFQVEVQDEGMSGVQFFFTLLVSILGLGMLAVIGAVVYGRWKQNRRKRFY